MPGPSVVAAGSGPVFVLECESVPWNVWQLIRTINAEYPDVFLAGTLPLAMRTSLLVGNVTAPGVS
jgi:hypothetical protein